MHKPRQMTLPLAAFVSWGLRYARGWPGNPGSDGASPYRLERRWILGAILLVVVLVLDLFWRSTRSVPVTPAARFGRSLSLPPSETERIAYGSYHSAVSQGEGELHPQVLTRTSAGFGW
jgi:hypothetical protein